MGFQRRVWSVERLAWIGLALVVAAGLLGAFGRGGPLSDAEATTPDGALRVRYDRVQRLLASTQFHVEAASAPAAGVVELRLGQDVLDGWELQDMTPPPAASRAEAGALVLGFPVAAAGAPVVLLSARPNRLGLIEGTISAGGGPPARLRVLVWP